MSTIDNMKLEKYESHSFLNTPLTALLTMQGFVSEVHSGLRSIIGVHPDQVENFRAMQIIADYRVLVNGYGNDLLGFLFGLPVFVTEQAPDMQVYILPATDPDYEALIDRITNAFGGVVTKENEAEFKDNNAVAVGVMVTEQTKQLLGTAAASFDDEADTETEDGETVDEAPKPTKKKRKKGNS